MSQRRSALGRGLGALISTPTQRAERRPADAANDPGPPTHPTDGPTQSSVTPTASPAPRGPQQLEIARIDPNPDQPRREFDPQALDQLARSIAQHGVLQPVVVRQAGTRYELVMGERRYRASQLAGRATIPAVVLDVDPADRLELAIVENVQRQDLNPIELAHAYQALADAGHTQEEIGRKVAMDRSSIANHIRLLDLGRSIQADVEAGRISMGHAKALLQLDEPAAREALRDRILKEGLSVRATEKAAREQAGGGKGRASSAGDGRAAAPALDPDTRAFLERIERHLQTRVKLHPGSGGAGRLEISYFNLEDLERLGDLLMGGDTLP
ncbi:MAG: ParB/RepB/Spo0J family partition protein [Spirochaetaceae bacterium]|nr:ParB/RepB/Spo0J family partition protein [Myxococcales bacterium]MCB9723956.1 ParB/RepB/Spo0J family partition protein [Spirochaetaceae bacterium]HPG25529.1 ParB/RepB/Spo0J family partition protein [Myxococcota bacterium]